MLREYGTLKKLREGETVEVEGCKFRMIPGDIQEGDFYIGERNTGPHLLTAYSIITDKTFILPYIIPVESAYCYNVRECVRVEEV